MLISSELLTQDQLNRALEIQKETLQRLGFILTHYGIISADALKQAHPAPDPADRLPPLPLEGRRLPLLAGDDDRVRPRLRRAGQRRVDPDGRRADDRRVADHREAHPLVRHGLPQEADRPGDRGRRRGRRGRGRLRRRLAPTRRRKQVISDKIRISREEKADLRHGRRHDDASRDVVEMSKLSEFDTAKALYELLTRDLIEEVRGSAAAAVLAQATPLDETEVAETPVPLPLVAVLALLAHPVAGHVVPESAQLARTRSARRSARRPSTKRAKRSPSQRIEPDRRSDREVQPRQRPPSGAPAGADAGLHLAVAAARSVGPRLQIPPAAAALPRHRLHSRREAGHGPLPLAHDRRRIALRRRIEAGDGRDSVAGLSVQRNSATEYETAGAVPPAGPNEDTHASAPALRRAASLSARHRTSARRSARHARHVRHARRLRLRRRRMGGHRSRDLRRFSPSNGMPVVGLNALQYFWTKRTPERPRAISPRSSIATSAQWHKSRVLLVGYSRGADVLPAMINRLPAETQAKIRADRAARPQPESRVRVSRRRLDAQRLGGRCR